MTQRLEKGTDHAQAKPQNSQLCSEATLLENKTGHCSIFLSSGYKNSFASSVLDFVLLCF